LLKKNQRSEHWVEAQFADRLSHDFCFPFYDANIPKYSINFYVDQQKMRELSERLSS